MIRGSCLCGAVAFEIVGEVTPIQMCHARRCRKAGGAASAPEMLAARDGFRFTRGRDQIKVYEAPILEAPPAYRRAFCGNCGSPVPDALERSPYVMLNPGVLDDDPGTRVFRHAFTGQAAHWHEISDELPQFDGQPPVPEGY